MDTQEKIQEALSHSFQDAYIRLEDDQGITGYIVSDRFQGISSLQRQELIERALSSTSTPLTSSERRRILMIAGLTPAEFDSVGSPVRIHQLKKVSGGRFRVILHGRLADADYVRQVLESAGLRTTEPTDSPGARGILVHFQVEEPRGMSLTKEAIEQVLKKDRYIEVMSNS